MTKFRIKVLELISKADLVNQMYEFLDVTVNFSTCKKFDFISLKITERGEGIYFQSCSDSNLNGLDKLINALDEKLLDAKKEVI